MRKFIADAPSVQYCCNEHLDSLPSESAVIGTFGIFKMNHALQRKLSSYSTNERSVKSKTSCKKTALTELHNVSDFLHASSLYLHLHAASFSRIPATMAQVPMPLHATKESP